MVPLLSKSELRKLAESRRRELGESIRAEKSRLITKQIVTDLDWQSAKNVCIYVWFKNEVQTDELIQSAWKEEKNVCVPLCGYSDQDKISLFKIDSFDDLKPGTFGIREPSAEIQIDSQRIVRPQNVDLFIVPGLAFDRQGNRLGWGGGYYDWILSRTKQATKIAIAFECQMVNSLPTEPQDIQMNKIVTEQCCYIC